MKTRNHRCESELSKVEEQMSKMVGNERKKVKR